MECINGNFIILPLFRPNSLIHISHKEVLIHRPPKDVLFSQAYWIYKAVSLHDSLPQYPVQRCQGFSLSIQQPVVPIIYYIHHQVFAENTFFLTFVSYFHQLFCTTFTAITICEYPLIHIKCDMYFGIQSISCTYLYGDHISVISHIF